MPTKTRARNIPTEEAEATDTPQAGPSQEESNSIIRQSLNSRTQAFLNEEPTGKALTETGAFPFGNKFFPSIRLNRSLGYKRSQFLSGHFPSKTYFERFSIQTNEDPQLCSCECEDSRDHLLLTCPDFSEHKQGLCSDLGIDPFSLSCQKATRDFQSLAKSITRVLRC